MILRLSGPFDLDATLCCGQVFRWQRSDDWWLGVVGDHVLRVRQEGDVLEFSGVNEVFIKHYFSLDHDIITIAEEIGKDSHIKAALRTYGGLRIVRQPPWECLVSFICATYKSVAAICQMLQKLSAKFGEGLSFEGYEYYAFPSADRLAAASLAELESCGLGYRASYVLETAIMVCNGRHDLVSIGRLPYERAKRALLDFPGVGLKVADCVLLFSLEKTEAFPVDVWVKRILLRYYIDHFDADFARKLATQRGLSDSSYARLNAFGRAYFGAYAGYAQEYLYHYERCFANRKLEKGNRAYAKAKMS